jgi:hypothetical protein
VGESVVDWTSCIGATVKWNLHDEAEARNRTEDAFNERVAARWSISFPDLLDTSRSYAGWEPSPALEERAVAAVKRIQEQLADNGIELTPERSNKHRQDAFHPRPKGPRNRH